MFAAASEAIKLVGGQETLAMTFFDPRLSGTRAGAPNTPTYGRAYRSWGCPFDV